MLNLKDKVIGALNRDCLVMIQKEKQSRQCRNREGHKAGAGEAKFSSFDNC